jgi:DNA helicase HerA-like ATPase
MDLSDPMKNCLTDALRSAYKKKQIPTLKDALELVADTPADSATQDAVIRRLKRFSGGSLGSIFCSDAMAEPISMFSKSMDLSVKNLTVDHKSSVGLLTFFLMRQALSYFKRKGKTRIVQHVIVIDEAPMVIGSNSKVEEEVVSMLQEIRKFGVGLILVCRNPGIGDDILRETNQKIAHRLAVPKDVAAIGEMLGLSAEDQKLLHSLPSGVAFARIGSNPTALVRIKR